MSSFPFSLNKLKWVKTYFRFNVPLNELNITGNYKITDKKEMKMGKHISSECFPLETLLRQVKQHRYVIFALELFKKFIASYVSVQTKDI